MPSWLSDLSDDTWRRLIVRSPPKRGKTTTIIATAPGPVYTINCDDPVALLGAKRHAKGRVAYDQCRTFDDMKRCIVTARTMIKEDGVKTVLVDPFTNWAGRLEDALQEENEKDTFAAWRQYGSAIRHVVLELFRLKAHVIFTMHYGVKRGKDGADEDEALLGGRMKEWVPSQFNDIVKLDMNREGKRIFITDSANGVGCRSMDGNEIIEADISALFALFEESAAGPKKTSVNKGASTAKPARR